MTIKKKASLFPRDNLWIFGKRTLLVMSVWATISVKTLGSSCDKRNPRGPFKISEISYTEKEISLEKYTLTMIKYPPTLDFWAHKREVYTAYCYDGSTFDTNTGCTRKFENDNLTISELENWDKKALCQVGIDCPPDGECWGSGAEACNSKTKTKDVGEKDLRWMGISWTKFPYHTCTMSWSCQIKSLKLPTHLRRKQGVFEICVSDNLGGGICGAELDKTHKLSEGFFLTRKPISMTPTFSTIISQCFVSIKFKISCLISSLEGEKNIGVRIDPSSGQGTIRNYVFRLTEKIKMPQLTYLVANSTSPEKVDTNFVEVDKAASIGSVIEIANLASSNQMQMQYNHIEIINENRARDEILRNIIVELGKIRLGLIPKIMGSRGSTKWINDDLFFIAPCYKETQAEFSNCMGPLIYRNNDYVMREKDETCVEFEAEKVGEINLFRNGNYSFESLEYLPPRTASLNWEGWDFIEKERNKISGKVAGDSGADSKSDYPGGVSSTFGLWSLIKDNIVIINTFLSFVSILLHIKR